MKRTRRLAPLLVLVVFTSADALAAGRSGGYDSLEDLLADFVDSAGPGVVAYLSVGQTTESAAVGLAILDRGTRLSVDDQFRIGSATKPFVAALLLQLAEEGLLDLEEPIGTYLPDRLAPRIPNAGTATVEQMLAMTSGIPDYIASDEFDMRVRENRGEWVDVTNVNDGVGLGDGGMVSTADELARLPLALWNGTLMSPESRVRMIIEVRSNYGLGIGVDRSPYGRLYSHAGATSGFQSVFVLVPSRDAVLVVLTNDFDSQIVEDLVYAMIEYAL